MRYINNYNYKVFLIIIFLSAIFLRFYNLNFNDLWSDEMVSFWISDPSIEYKETFLRIFSSNWMVLYELLLKNFNILFGYDVHYPRIFSFIISVLSLIFYFLLF